MGLKYNWHINIVNDSIEISDPTNSILYALPLNSLILQKLNSTTIRFKGVDNNFQINMDYVDVIEPASANIDALITTLENTLFVSPGGGGGGYGALPPIGCSIDGLGSVIVAGQVGFSAIVNPGTISGWTVIGDVSGDVVFDIKRNGVSIIGAGNKPTITGGTNATATTSGWTSTTIAEGDFIEYVIESVVSFKKLSLFLKIV